VRPDPGGRSQQELPHWIVHAVAVSCVSGWLAGWAQRRKRRGRGLTAGADGRSGGEGKSGGKESEDGSRKGEMMHYG
jgi:hypothetical protein